MQRMLRITFWIAVLGAPAGWAADGDSADPAQEPNRGLEIAREQDRRGSGFNDMRADLRMVLISKRGETSERELEMRVLEGTGDKEGDKSLILFQSPPDVRGTALLTWSYKERDDDQWLYLPALRRVKRIASQNKSGPFMGSEFAYEDMRPQEVEKYTYQYLRTESCRDQQCFVVERYPVSEHSGYTKQVTWIDTEEYRTFKVEYYDRKKSHLKTLRNTGFKHHKEEWWRPSKMSMQNHQTGKATDLHWSNYRFDTGLTEADFSRNSLKRAR
jgi:outer membrane lipoprotein-sorting protein